MSRLPNSSRTASNMLGDGCGIGEVGTRREYAPSEVAQFAGELLGARRLVAEVDDDVGTRFGEVSHGVGADPPR